MKKNKTLVLILGILLAAAVVVGLIFGVKALTGRENEPTQPASTGEPAGTEPAKTGEPGSTEPASTEPEDPEITAVRAKEYYSEDGVTADDPRMDAIAAECGDYQLTNRQAQIFYGMQYISFMNNYGAYAEYFGLDSTKPLKDQLSMVSDLSWEQYFLMSAMEEFQEYASAASAATAAGYTLPEEEQADLESFLSSLTEEAAFYGFDSADAYLQDSFGDAIRFADYENYLRLYFLAMSYENSLYMSIEPTEEDLQAYVNEHEEEFAEIDMEETSVDVRHILILSDPDDDGTATEEEKAAAKAKAEALLAEYLTNPTEEHFADLAIENSEDPGSADNGGLYEGVYPGQMVDTFNDWCFDAARQVGDTGIVETEYGYHVMYFVGSDLYWKAEARHSLRMEILQPKLDEMLAASPLTTHYENVVLSPLPLTQAEE